MNYYLAPMEGITGYIYRNAYHEFFQPMDKYFTPFIAANLSKRLKSREMNDVLPEHNKGMYVVPQILCNRADAFLDSVYKLEQYGYSEVNLNLGCPSRTVVSKNRGSGFLADPDELDRFFDAVFSQSEIKISVKTRIGLDSPEEFYDLLPVFNRYPLEELIVHPRIQTDYYKNTPNMDIFRYAAAKSSNSVCYNGDIFTMRDYIKFCEDFPQIDGVMLGRGIIANPAFLDVIVNHRQPEKETLRKFHDRLYLEYQQIFSGERNVLFKMKEFWTYLIRIFLNSEKYGKAIKKAEKFWKYEEAVNAVFEDLDLIDMVNMTETD